MTLDTSLHGQSRDLPRPPETASTAHRRDPQLTREAADHALPRKRLDSRRPSQESACESDKGTRNTADGLKSLPFNGLRETAQESAGQGGSAPTWTRTMNPLIKSQLENQENPGKNGVCGNVASISPAPNLRIDSELQAVIDAWPSLPEAIQAGILAMVSTAGRS